MQSTQNMSIATTIRGNAFNPIIISNEDHGAITYAETPFFSGFGKADNSSSDGSSSSSSSSNTTTMPSNSPHLAPATTMQHPHDMSAGTSTIHGYAHNPIVISDDEDEDDYSVRLFLSVFTDTKAPSGLSAQESTVRELVREMMGCNWVLIFPRSRWFKGIFWVVTVEGTCWHIYRGGNSGKIIWI
jgi:hypothetical protein